MQLVVKNRKNHQQLKSSVALFQVEVNKAKASCAILGCNNVISECADLIKNSQAFLYSSSIFTVTVLSLSKHRDVPDSYTAAELKADAEKIKGHILPHLDVLPEVVAAEYFSIVPELKPKATKRPLIADATPSSSSSTTVTSTASGAARSSSSST